MRQVLIFRPIGNNRGTYTTRARGDVQHDPKRSIPFRGLKGAIGPLPNV